MTYTKAMVAAIIRLFLRCEEHVVVEYIDGKDNERLYYECFEEFRAIVREWYPKEML